MYCIDDKVQIIIELVSFFSLTLYDKKTNK